MTGSPPPAPAGEPAASVRLMDAERLLRRLLGHADAGRNAAVAAGYGQPSPERVEETRVWSKSMARVCLKLAAALDDCAVEHLGGPLERRGG